MRPIPTYYLYANKPSDFLSFTMAWSPVTPARAGAPIGGTGTPAGHPGPPKALTKRSILTYESSRIARRRLGGQRRSGTPPHGGGDL
jgi:hypothetical protein